MKAYSQLKENAPCKTCGSRQVGCHSSCKLYNNWKAELDEANTILLDEKEKSQDVAMENLLRRKSV